jgi:hypothetical protein
MESKHQRATCVNCSHGSAYCPSDRAPLNSDARLGNNYGHENGRAEYIIGMMIMLIRSLGHLDTRLLQGRWHSQRAAGAEDSSLWLGRTGKTLGILSIGRIGRAVERRVAPFGIRTGAIRSKLQTELPNGVGSKQGRVLLSKTSDGILSENRQPMRSLNTLEIRP